MTNKCSDRISQSKCENNNIHHKSQEYCNWIKDKNKCIIRDCKISSEELCKNRDDCTFLQNKNTCIVNPNKIRKINSHNNYYLKDDYRHKFYLNPSILKNDETNCNNNNNYTVYNDTNSTCEFNCSKITSEGECNLNKDCDFNYDSYKCKKKMVKPISGNDPTPKDYQKCTPSFTIDENDIKKTFNINKSTPADLLNTCIYGEKPSNKGLMFISETKHDESDINKSGILYDKGLHGHYKNLTMKYPKLLRMIYGILLIIILALNVIYNKWFNIIRGAYLLRADDDVPMLTGPNTYERPSPIESIRDNVYGGGSLNSGKITIIIFCILWLISLYFGVISKKVFNSSGVIKSVYFVSTLLVLGLYTKFNNNISDIMTTLYTRISDLFTRDNAGQVQEDEQAQPVTYEEVSYDDNDNDDDDERVPPTQVSDELQSIMTDSAQAIESDYIQFYKMDDESLIAETSVGGGNKLLTGGSGPIINEETYYIFKELNTSGGGVFKKIIIKPNLDNYKVTIMGEEIIENNDPKLKLLKKVNPVRNREIYRLYKNAVGPETIQSEGVSAITVDPAGETAVVAPAVAPAVTGPEIQSDGAPAVTGPEIQSDGAPAGAPAVTEEGEPEPVAVAISELEEGDVLGVIQIINDKIIKMKEKGNVYEGDFYKRTGIKLYKAQEAAACGPISVINLLQNMYGGEISTTTCSRDMPLGDSDETLVTSYLLNLLLENNKKTKDEHFINVTSRSRSSKPFDFHTDIKGGNHWVSWIVVPETSAGEKKLIKIDPNSIFNTDPINNEGILDKSIIKKGNITVFSYQDGLDLLRNSTASSSGWVGGLIILRKTTESHKWNGKSLMDIPDLPTNLESIINNYKPGGDIYKVTEMYSTMIPSTEGGGKRKRHKSFKKNKNKGKKTQRVKL